MLITNGANGPAIFELATSTLQLEVSKTFQWVVIRVPEDWGFYGWCKKTKTPKRRDIHHPVESSCHLHWPGTAKRVTVTAWLKSQAAVAKSSQRILEIGVPLSHHGLNIEKSSARFAVSPTSSFVWMLVAPILQICKILSLLVDLWGWKGRKLYKFGRSRYVCITSILNSSVIFHLFPAFPHGLRKKKKQLPGRPGLLPASSHGQRPWQWGLQCPGSRAPKIPPPHHLGSQGVLHFAYLYKSCVYAPPEMLSCQKYGCMIRDSSYLSPGLYSHTRWANLCHMLSRAQTSNWKHLLPNLPKSKGMAPKILAPHCSKYWDAQLGITKLVPTSWGLQGMVMP